MNLLDPSFWLSVLYVAIGLGFVIFIHELGHFMVAKWCGVKCEKFYVGFDFFDLKIGNVVILPRALFKYQWGETEYGIGIIPLGGYVKMLGQDDNPANAEREAERTRIVREGGVVVKEAGSEEGHIPSGDLPAEPTSETPTYELDPRSYTAKSVPQRMAIISAGVIMNLISGVILAAIAYGWGVPYMPTIVGNVQPGSPAYVSGVQPGDYIVSLNGGERSLDQRWERDLKMTFGLSRGQEVPITVGRGGNLEGAGFAEEVDLVLIPEQPDPDYPVATIGVLNMSIPVVAGETLLNVQHSGTANAGFVGGDKIVAIEGSFGRVEPESGLDVDRVLANHPSETLTLIVERTEAGEGDKTSSTEVKVSLPPSPRKTIGVQMKMLPVSAIQKDSPAAQAGVQKGDVLAAFDGQPIVDPPSLDAAALAFAQAKPDQPAVLTVERNGKQVEVEIVPRQRTQRPVVSMPMLPFGVDTLGIAVPVDQEVVSVDPNGPAAKADLKPGDRIVAFDFVVDDAKRKELEEQKIEIASKRRELQFKNSWASMDQVVQDHTTSGIALKLWRQRGDELAEVVIEPQVVEESYLGDRGLILESLQRVRVATGPLDALRLGVRETWEGVVMVGVTLQKLATGQVSVTALGGPLTIAHAAKTQADAGLPKFLIFLTLLSANLAVMNFLPIPVLDGGHMMFLIFEGIRGKPLNEKWQMGLTVLGLFMVLGLMVFVMGLDITRYYAYFTS